MKCPECGKTDVQYINYGPSMYDVDEDGNSCGMTEHLYQSNIDMYYECQDCRCAFITRRRRDEAYDALLDLIKELADARILTEDELVDLQVPEEDED